MNKDQLRLRMKAARASMTDAERSQASDTIQQKVIVELQRLKPRKVHCYTAIAANHEVDTTKVFKFLHERNIVVHTSKKIAQTWQNVDAKTHQPVSEDQYDIIIVPMLAGDKQGNRLGYGSGFYDKFLTTQPQAHSIGLCYSKNIVNSVPTESHDQKVEQTITEH